MMCCSEEMRNASDSHTSINNPESTDAFLSADMDSSAGIHTAAGVYTYSTIKTILERDQRLVYKLIGTSMLPMLRPDRDMVVFVPVKDRLKKYDVALYMRGKKHVAHRVIKVQESGYLIRGDNTYTMEIVAEDDVIGVLTNFVRNGKQYHVSHKGYRFYARLWCVLYPVRYSMKHSVIWTKRLLRKLGITPLIKRLLKK